MLRLDYVMSGPNYTRITTDGAYGNAEILTKLQQVFANEMQTPNHAFSLLYNAYQEKEFGPMFQTYYGEHVNSIHADSGGLQMVTQGIVQTPQIRKDVYINQGQYSDVAMSFDVIPIAMSGSRSLRLDVKNRFFDLSTFANSAKESGIHLKEQIEYFESINSKTKPLLIVHGNDLETYKQWVEVALSQIPEHAQMHIGGVAMGGAALGTGFLQDFMKAYFYSRLPLPNHLRKHLHLLGVGSISRLIPAIMQYQMGNYDKDIVISYDSSTHSSGPEMGRYYTDGKTVKFGKLMDDRFKRMYADIVKNFPEYDVSLADTFRAMTCGGYRAAEEIFKSPKPGTMSFVFSALSAIKNFKSHVDSIVSNKDKLLQNVKEDYYLPVKSFYGITDEYTFKQWQQNAGRMLTSQPIAAKIDDTIDALF